MLLSIINAYYYFFNRFSLNFVKKAGVVFGGVTIHAVREFGGCARLPFKKTKKSVRTDSFARCET